MTVNQVFSTLNFPLADIFQCGSSMQGLLQTANISLEVHGGDEQSEAEQEVGQEEADDILATQRSSTIAASVRSTATLGGVPISRMKATKAAPCRNEMASLTARNASTMMDQNQQRDDFRTVDVLSGGASENIMQGTVSDSERYGLGSSSNFRAAPALCTVVGRDASDGNGSYPRSSGLPRIGRMRATQASCTVTRASSSDNESPQSDNEPGTERRFSQQVASSRQNQTLASLSQPGARLPSSAPKKNLPAPKIQPPKGIPPPKLTNTGATPGVYKKVLKLQPQARNVTSSAGSQIPSGGARSSSHTVSLLGRARTVTPANLGENIHTLVVQTNAFESLFLDLHDE